ncbi:MAG: DNA-processing protein DprA [Muribaculaceae bacterium]|nr:DNA-processing protein DprA [Muribaculaceae bacterium]
MTDHGDLIHRIALSSIHGINPDTATRITTTLGGLREFFEMPEQTLRSRLESSSRLLSDQVRQKALREAATEIAFVERNSIHTLWYTDPHYPQRLLECTDAPLMLYTLGDTDLNAARIVSIVGTRHATAYGISFVETLVKDLASRLTDPLIVVSGLAYGIDIAAHRAALKEGVPTVGVLAHGLNTIYPAAHRDSAARMIHSGGMLLTDYRSVDAIHRGNFLARNRIVAGMADCLVVAESDSHGGALVTARLASAYARDVFALPGRISDRYSRGCNALISDDIAHLITSADDLIALMRWPVKAPEGTQPTLFPQLSPQEEAITTLLADRGEATLSDLITALDTRAHLLMSTLIDLESRGLILALPGSRYRLA